MSIPNVRRLTAALTLAAVLCLAAPAAGTPVDHAVSQMAVGSNFLGQILAWLDSLWPGQAAQAPTTKTGSEVDLPGQPGTNQSHLPKLDQGGAPDPNG